MDVHDPHCLLGTDKVSPLAVYSSKELVQTFEELLATLSNKSHDFWQRRCEALRSIRALVLGGAADYDCFLSCLNSLKVPMADAIGDLRSTLVREACATVALLSQTCGRSFVPMAEVLIPAMLKQIAVTIQVISEAANLSLRAVLRHTHNTRLLPLILSTVGKNKGPVVRARCIEYVLVVLELWSWQDIEKHADKIDEVVVQCLADAQPDVRAGARRCVAEMCQTYQARGERILRGLDAQMQKKIFEETERGAPRPRRARSSMKPPSLLVEGASSNDGGVPSSSGHLDAKTPTYAGHLSTVQRSKVDKDKDREREKAVEARGGGGGGGGGGGAVSGRPDTGASASPRPETRGLGLGAARRVARGKSFGGAELESLKTALQQQQVGAATAASAVLQQPLAANNNAAFPTDSVPTSKGRILTRGPQRVATADAEAPASPHVRRNAQRAAHGQEGGAGSDGGGGGGGKGRLSEDELMSLVVKCGNALWSLRERSLLELAAEVESTPPSRALLASAPKLVEAATERVADAHYKVQNAALSLLAALAGHLSACLSPHVDAVLRQVLPRLIDKKGSRKLCISLLEELRYASGPQMLVTAVVKAMDGTSNAVKVSALEYLTADLRLLAPLLSASPSLARGLLGHALPLCADRVLEVRRGACVAVMQLRALAPLALYESLAKPWAPGQVAAVKKGLVAAGLLDLDRELATFLRTKRLDPAVAEEANRLLASAIASTSKPGTAPHADDEAGRLHANVQALANGSASAYARDLVANRVGAEDQEGAGEGGSGEDADSAGASGRWRQLVGVEKTVGQGWTAPVYNPTAYQVGEESDEDSGWGGAGVDSGGAEDDVEEIKLTEDGGLEQDGIISATLVLPGDASLPCAHKRRSGCGAWAREDVDYSLGSGGHAGKRQAGFGWKEGWAEGGREEVVGAEMRQGGGSNKTNHVAYPNSQAAREAAVDEGEGEGEGEEEGEGRSGQRASGRAWSGEREAQEKGQRWASAAEGRGARGRGGEYKQRGDGGTMPGLRVGTELCDVGGKAEWERVLSRALGGVTSAAKHGHDAQTQEALVALLSVCKQVPAHLWRPAGGKGSGGGGLLVQLLVVLGEMTKHASGGGVLGAGGQGPSRTAMGAEVLDKVLHVYEWVVGGLAEECGGMCMSHVLVEALLSAVSAAATPMSRSTLSKIEELITALLAGGHPEYALQTLARAVSEEEAPALQVAIKVMGKLACASPQPIVAKHLHPLLLPPLFRAFAHPHADVRKAVVFCLVDLYRVMGQELMALLDQGLSNSQLKLVTIYINRLQS